MDNFVERAKAIFASGYANIKKVLSGGNGKFIIGGAALIISAIIIAVVINNSGYSVLFTGMTDEEAVSIVAKLQEDGINYKYDGSGEILVSNDEVDQARANLVVEGYPKSGFSYGTYISNAGGMTTDSEKQQYELYDLQDRIAATIRLFYGVHDAKVTIALAEEERYVLSDIDAQDVTTASVTVIMDNFGSPTAEQVVGIQHLLSTSVIGLLPENVGVFDGNGQNVTQVVDQNETITDETLARQLELEYAQKITTILPYAEPGGVRVAVNVTLNTDDVIKEIITYTTPNPTDNDDDYGIIGNETYDTATEGGTIDGGEVGTEENAEAPNITEDEADETSVLYDSATREYLVNQMIEQIDQGENYVEDITVTVALHPNDTINAKPIADIKNAIALAVGIPLDIAEDKIFISIDPFNDSIMPDSPIEDVINNLFGLDPLMIAIIGGGVALLLIIFIIIMLILGGKRKKKRLAAAAAAEAEAALVALGKMPVLELTPELMSQQNDRSHELRETIRKFSEDNPQISAEMIKSWLNGGESSGS